MSADTAATVQLDFEAIKRIIPQRFPFLMLDRIVDMEPGIRAVGVKNLTGNEWFYQGHFPRRAVTPGAMIGEAVAQTGIVFFHHWPERPPVDDVTYLLGAIKMRFLEPVWPGDQMRVEVTPVKLTVTAAILATRVTVNGRLVARGEFLLSAKANAE